MDSTYDGSNNTAITTNQSYDPTWSKLGDKFVFNQILIVCSIILYAYLKFKTKTHKFSNQSTSKLSDDDKYTIFTPLEMPEKPKGAKWNDPAIEIDNIKFRSDGKGYLNQGFSQIFILPVEGGTPRQITTLKNDAKSPTWLSKSEIIFSSNLHENSDLEPRDSELYVIDIKTKKIKVLTKRKGPDFSPQVLMISLKLLLGFRKYLGYQQNDLYINQWMGKYSNISENLS